MGTTLKKILVSTSNFNIYPEQCLGKIKNKYKMILNPLNRRLSEQELYKLLEEHRPAGLLAGTEIISKNTLEVVKEYLNVISRVGSGWDNIDLKYAKKVGIKIFRTKGVLNNSVAELTIGFIIDALRKITINNNQLKNGLWEKVPGYLLNGKKIGIIGFGQIGQTVGRLLRAFNCELYYNDYISYNFEGAKRLSKEKMLKECEVITIHTSGEEQILGSDEFNLFKNNPRVIINTSRGNQIDQEALYDYLNKNPYSTACLDVFQQEPYYGKLLKLDNIITTPHIGSYSIESRVEMEKMALDALLSGLKG